MHEALCGIFSKRDVAQVSIERGPVEMISDRRITHVLAVVLGLSYAYFFQGGGFNQNTRVDVLYAVLHNHTLQIDDVHDNTEDKALFGGHHYCDKAPGLQLFALPATFVFSAMASAVGWPLTDCRGFTLLAYMATLVASGCASVWSAMVVFRVVRLLGGNQEGAAMAAMALALGSPMWAYATLFWGHALVASLLVTTLWLGLKIHRAGDPCASIETWAVLGGCAGWAVLTSYPAVVPAFILVLAVMLSTLRRTPWRVCLPSFAAATAAALVCFALLMAHNQAVAGSPFALSYTHTQGFDGMKRGFFGVAMPQLAVTWEVFFGTTRGLFLLAPAFLVGLFGLVQMARVQDAAFVGRLGLCLVGFFCLLNASYFYWNGGLYLWAAPHGRLLAYVRHRSGLDGIARGQPLGACGAVDDGSFGRRMVADGGQRGHPRRGNLGARSSLSRRPSASPGRLRGAPSTALLRRDTPAELDRAAYLEPRDVFGLAGSGLPVAIARRLVGRLGLPRLSYTSSRRCAAVEAVGPVSKMAHSLRCSARD